MDYISRDDVLRNLIEGDGDDEFTEGYNFAVNEYREKIKAMPAAGVQPIKYGRWEYYKNNGIFDTHKCTLCGEKYEMYMDIEPTTIYKYCPNCGARMDGEQNET